MTGQELSDARVRLGHGLGLDRALRPTELGRALGLAGSRPSESVRKWERGGPTGPVSAAVRAWLDLISLGQRPPDLVEAIGRRPSNPRDAGDSEEEAEPSPALSDHPR
ncbi:hypothetical protein ACQVP2_22210 [Methylobacterium aquaticum]|uniref:hypothetical protein n=1 Tax=Methylobacterium aquaticum TaxID=270351 RepID=UPI003D177071